MSEGSVEAKVQKGGDSVFFRGWGPRRLGWGGTVFLGGLSGREAYGSARSAQSAN